MKHNISSRGIIIRDEAVLFIEYDHKRGICYSLPGGSQEVGEDLKKTLVREFKEETSLDIEVGELAFVREFIYKNPDFEGWQGGIHQVEVVFFCHLQDAQQEAKIGEKPDISMLNFKWIPLADFEQYKLYPETGLKELIEQRIPKYLPPTFDASKKKVDKRKILEENPPFAYKITKNKTLIYYNNKIVKTLNAKKSTEFQSKIQGKSDFEIQLILAKITKNFKRGNERVK